MSTSSVVSDQKVWPTFAPDSSNYPSLVQCDDIYIFSFSFPSALQHKANLARIRDNQRRSRARRREYLQELEQRLRVCELQGIEASAEVQMAARRVAEENKQLRELLNKYGISDEYIAHYLQVGAVSPPYSGRGQSFRAGDPGAAVQSLQQLIMPRRPAGIDHSVSFPLPNPPSSRKTPIPGGSASASPTVWESPQQSLAPYTHQQQIGVVSSVMNASDQHQYSPTTFSGGAVPARQTNFVGQMPPTMLNDSIQPIVTSQSMPMDSRSAMNYHFPMSAGSEPPIRDYGPPVSGC